MPARDSSSHVRFVAIAAFAVRCSLFAVCHSPSSPALDPRDPRDLTARIASLTPSFRRKPESILILLAMLAAARQQQNGFRLSPE
ncbi:hypothetical protein J5226_15265 [Lysobacter sp. K5869]|uniref:hypothetical protein n=1 Tax=Lysobacter sp. K5869 TaxID=2820808 RepID=UPI001C0648E3|nr:hypothetical protein [Lysobacter sp. K5869]QWP75001.1 hypothetical protein J5226_15265 [Lysobacter sp. K5869]